MVAVLPERKGLLLGVFGIRGFTHHAQGDGDCAGNGQLTVAILCFSFPTGQQMLGWQAF